MFAWRHIRAGITTTLLIYSCGHFTLMSAQAAAQQTVSVLSTQQDQDNKGLSAALITFKKNYGGVGSFLRSSQTAEPPALHVIDDLQKRLGKDMTARGPADIREIAAAVESCISYLSSPNLVSYSEPTVAQQIRSHANSTLKNMNEVSSSTTGLELNGLLARVKEDSLQAIADKTTGDQPSSENAKSGTARSAPLVTYQRPDGAPVLPGRISAEELQAILVDASEENQQAAITLLSQASAVSSDLLSIQSKARAYRNFATHPLIQEISSLQHRLGSSLQPQQITDVVELNQLLSNCLRIFGSLAPPESFNTTASIRAALGDLGNRQAQIKLTASAIVQIEGTLDRGNLIEANTAFRQLEKDSFASQFAPSRRYLQSTLVLRQDLSAYAETSQLPRVSSNSPIAQEVTIVANEVAKRDASVGKALTNALLNANITTDTQTLESRLHSLPAFVFDPNAYKAIPVASSTNVRDAQSRLESLNAKLSASSDLASLLTSQDSMSQVEALFGTAMSSELRTKGAEIEAAEAVAANLSEELQKYQQRLDEAENRREALAEEKDSLAVKIVNGSLMVVMLEDKFKTTTVMGYEMEANKQRQELSSLIVRDHGLLDASVWRAIDDEFNRVLPGLTVSQASETELLIAKLRRSAN